MAKRKKPDPEIYNMALDTLGILPEQALVIEDSHIGVKAAKQAKCTVLATYNGYTKNEDLSPADFIVSCLGDPDGEKAVVRQASRPIAPDGVVRLSCFLD
jgi:beta-phosphoglucomutase-like phosphatase (HAD superfamily)